MPHSLGSTTKHIFEQGPEAHKLHVEFEAHEALKKGQLVTLNSDGEAAAAAADAPQHTILGIAIMDAATGEMVTIATRGYAVVMGEAAANSLTPGVVESGGFNGTSGYMEYAAVSGADAAAQSVLAIGWALEGGDNGDVIKVLIKD